MTSEDYNYYNYRSCSPLFVCYMFDSIAASLLYHTQGGTKANAQYSLELWFWKTLNHWAILQMTELVQKYERTIVGQHYFWKTYLWSLSREVYNVNSTCPLSSCYSHSNCFWIMKSAPRRTCSSINIFFCIWKNILVEFSTNPIQHLI